MEVFALHYWFVGRDGTRYEIKTQLLPIIIYWPLLFGMDNYYIDDEGEIA